MAIMTTFLLLLGSVLSLSSVVNGGNHLWERPFIATNNDTHHHSIHKRQLVIVPGDGVGIWLSRTIKYCFANTQSADMMGAFIVSAMTVWYLSDRIDVGMKDVTANVAHEIGHAWGAPKYVILGPSLHPSSHDGPRQLSFSVLPPKSQRLRQHSKAKANGFSAAEFLPLPGGTGRSTVGIQQGSLYQNVDWQSIMLYPSFAGGKDDGQGGKLPVLRMIDDKGHLTNIGENLTPSQADTQAIIQLYNVHESTTPGPSGIESPGHPMFSKFKGILKKKNC
ncbi:hypothetical protein HYALB_00000298 [Hymenoscyphus albidus]|uniref:Uncharacterized protein n=1 Tax=Hymenoscyphus albidus TaxID=595503 RepID=A0A9N9LVF8_9HELO|nr:hypothetical protein HYALB_00000298 [Hymenoscyphus albidus]